MPSLRVDHEFRFRDNNASVGRYRPRQPDIAANNGATADDGCPAKDGGAGVNYDVVLDCGMALLSADHPAFIIHSEAQRSECHALIQFDAIADICCLSDDHTRPMIDKEP